MSVPPRSRTPRTDPFISLSVLGINYDEVVPALQEICHLAGLFFNAPLSAVAWLGNPLPTILGCNSPCTATTYRLARYSRLILQMEDILVLDEDALNSLCDTPDTASINDEPLRFFAAVPVFLTHQIRVGALCVADYQARRFSAVDARNLRDFASLVSTTLDHCKNLTELRRQEQFLADLSYTDTLTGLPNRDAFLLELDRYFFQQQALVLIAIDVDSFKEINNTIGHHVGDQLLTEVGQRISTHFPSGTFIARVDSNTFTVLTPHAPLALALSVQQLEPLQRCLNMPFYYAEHTLDISVSMGLCQAPAQAENADQLIRGTEIALYQAKKAGGNRSVAFEPEMRHELEARANLLREVRRGIERKEFLLYYQPIYDMQTQTLSGLEALMRWSLPEKGILAPAYFEAAFHDQILAPQLGNTALRSAFTQMRHWVDQGFDFKRVSVNVATAQFYPHDLATHILDMLKEYQLQPDQLTLEITESIYLGPGATAVENTLRALHEAGVKIALDDFGTGYASLTQLQRLPIDSIKIDKSFVQNPKAHPIVDAIIALGQNLDMQVVAEGIETGAHQVTLLQSGCRYGQGYYLGKPMPAEFYG